MTKVKDMTTGNPIKIIIAFSLPLMAGNVFQQLYTVVDTMIVGKYLGVQALAALGATDWLNWCMLGIIQGLTQGFSVKMAQDFGGQQLDSLKKTIATSAILSALLSLVLVMLGLFAARPTLLLLQTPAEIMDYSLTYMYIMFLGVPIVMLYNLLASILRAVGDSKTPLYAMILASFVNIGLDLLFVMVLDWGVAGAAIATLIAQLVSSIYCLYFIRKDKILAFQLHKGTVDARLSLTLMELGLPMAMQNAIIAVGGMILQFVVNSFGVIFIAGFIATNKLYGILEMAALSFGFAMVTYMGQNIGAGKLERIRSGMKAALTLGAVTSVVIGASMVLFGKVILSWFLSGTPEEVEQALAVAYKFLCIMSVSLPILYLLHITRAAIQGLGNTLIPMLSGAAEFVMRTGSAFLLPGLLGQDGLLFAETAAWTGADVILVIGYFIVTRKLFKSK